MVDAACSTNLLLETIMEETSDDLRSETSESDYNSGLLTDSVSTVIHVPSYDKNHQSKGGRNSYWNERKCSLEINTDPGVQDDDEVDDFTDEDEDGENEDDGNSNDSEDADSDEQAGLNAVADGFPSRTNSLLQFENLEKHYENIFQMQRTATDMYDLSGVYENKGPSRSWRFKSSSQPENLNHFHDIDDDNDSSSLSSSCSSSSSSLLSSDEILSSSYSSRFDSLSRKLSLRSFRSIDSLTSLHQKQEKEQDLLHSVELSQSLNDNICKIDSQPADEILPAHGLYKTMECLSEIPSVYCNEVANAAAAVVAVKKDENKDQARVDLHQQQPTKTQRSTENLSEDSGFGDHITKESSKKMCGDDYVDEEKSADVTDESIATTVEVEASKGNDSVDSCQNELLGKEKSRSTSPYFADGNEQQDPDYIFSCSSNNGNNCSGWQSDPNLLNTTFVICEGARSDAVVSCNQVDDEDECYNDQHVHSEDSCSTGDTVASRLTVASTPNLYQEGNDEEYHYKRKVVCDRFSGECNDSTVSLSQIYTLKRINFTNESQLSAGVLSSKGSNMQIMTSFINLTNNGSKQEHNGSSKGVHFSPIVSEVDWGENYNLESYGDRIELLPLDENIPKQHELQQCEDENDKFYNSDYERLVRQSPLLRECVSSHSTSAVNTLDNDDGCGNEVSPPLDILVEKLLSDSVSSLMAASKRNNKEFLEQAQQRPQLDLIASSPLLCGSGGDPATSSSKSSNNNSSSNNNESSLSLTESSFSSLWLSPMIRTNTSYSAGFNDTMDSNSADNSENNYMDFAGSPICNEKLVTSPTKSSPVGKLGGFFQRFSLKRLSGRKSKRKAALTVAPPVVVGVLPKSNSRVDGSLMASASNSRIISQTDDYNADEDNGYEVSGGNCDVEYRTRSSYNNEENDEVYNNCSVNATGAIVSSKPPLPPLITPAASVIGVTRRRLSGENNDGAPQRADFVQLSSDAVGQQYHYNQEPQKQQMLQQYSQQYCIDLNTPTALRKNTVAAVACIDRPLQSSSTHRAVETEFGLLETDIDSNVTSSSSNVSNSVNGSSNYGHHMNNYNSGSNSNNKNNVANSPANSKKSRSLLNLDNGRLSLLSSSSSSTKASLGCATDTMKANGSCPHHSCNDYRAKSMEFLLDKENQAAVKVRTILF